MRDDQHPDQAEAVPTQYEPSAPARADATRPGDPRDHVGSDDARDPGESRDCLDASDQSPTPTTVEATESVPPLSGPSRVRATFERARSRCSALAARARHALPPLPSRVTRDARDARDALVARVSKGASAVKARPRRSASIAAGVLLVAAVVPAVALRATRGQASELLVLAAPSALVSAKPADAASSAKATAPSVKPFQPPSALAGLDLKSISVDDTGAVATAASGRIAKLTLDPKAQIAATRLMAKHKLPEAAVVLLDPATGKVLVYASRGGGGHDLAAEATSPSASVFKVVTGSALVQVAGVPIDTKVCYGGGDSKLEPRDLKDDPKLDKYCATMSQAMGRSINAVFGKLAQRKLAVSDLNTVAGNLGFGVALPFDVVIQPSKLDVPSDPLNFARTAAGFYNTTLSPLHAAMLAGTIGNGGTMMRPWIVSSVLDGNQTLYKAPSPSIFRKAIDASTASSVGSMMLETVANGTSFKAFHDAKGKAFIPGVEIAGKTGTLNLTPGSSAKLVTWFVGYAPAKNPKVAIATLIVNDPVWKVKANTLSREVLQYWFAENGYAGVTAPSLDP